LLPSGTPIAPACDLNKLDDKLKRVRRCLSAWRRFDKEPCCLFKGSNKHAEMKNGEKRTMKLYDSVGPNPRIVRMFMAEKGIEMPKQTVDLRGGENRQEAHLKRNPHGQMPTLELDDGSYLSEITAICEYLEEKKPSPAMIGATAEQRAECRMWTRRVDLNICEPLANGYRFGEALKFFEKRIPVAPEASPGLKMISANRLQWLNGQMAGKDYLCGKRFTLADMLLYCWIDFGGQVGQPLDPANANLAAWFARVAERPSVKA
jgi:glutathione S-transferase